MTFDPGNFQPQALSLFQRGSTPARLFAISQHPDGSYSAEIAEQGSGGGFFPKEAIRDPAFVNPPGHLACRSRRRRRWRHMDRRPSQVVSLRQTRPRHAFAHAGTAFDPRQTGDARLTQVYLNAGEEISGGTVAARWRDEFLIGALFDEKVLICKPNP